MPWLQLELTLDAAKTERVEAGLLTAGALAVTFKDAASHPLYAPAAAHSPIWPQTRLSALFPESTDPDALRAVLVAALGRLPSHQLVPLGNREWSREWLRDFKPMRFGRRLWIVPSTHEPPDPVAVNLRLDPGLAFGTGRHTTTALCLEWLDGTDLTGKTVIDYGCGSGVLAIAAAQLGARQVWAVDNDPQALVATCENARRNQVSDLLRIEPVESTLVCSADVLLANILATPLCELASRFAEWIKPGGRIVLSGILEGQRNEIQAAYAQAFRITHVVRRQEWLRMDGQRLSGSR